MEIKSSSFNDSEVVKLQRALDETHDKFNRACRHIVYLDDQISYLRKLFRRAERNNGYAIRYNLRMQLSIVSGVKVMYHHYAALNEEKMNALRAQLAACFETALCEGEEQSHAPE